MKCQLEQDFETFIVTPSLAVGLIGPYCDCDKKYWCVGFGWLFWTISIVW